MINLPNFFLVGFIGAVFYVPASRFTFIFVIFFLVRCTILLFAYVYEITNDIFIFVLLIMCEVVPCGVLWLEVTVSSVKNSQVNTGKNGEERKNSLLTLIFFIFCSIIFFSEQQQQQQQPKSQELNYNVLK